MNNINNRIKFGLNMVFYRDKDTDVEHSTPLILVHGAGDSRLTWSAELRRLAGWRVLTIDLPGHGRAGTQGYQSVIAYADSIRAMLDELKIEQAYLAGHSMGGAIVQTMAVHMPKRVAGLILIATGAYLPVNASLLELAQTDLAQMDVLLTKWKWGATAGANQKRMSTRQLLELPAAVVYGDYYACSQFDLRDRLPSVYQPALIIGGGADKMTPFKFSEELHALLPNSTLHKIEDAGHMLHLEYSQEVGNLVGRWLAQQEK